MLVGWVWQEASQHALRQPIKGTVRVGCLLGKQRLGRGGGGRISFFLPHYPPTGLPA